jgi:hypothetical protein
MTKAKSSAPSAVRAYLAEIGQKGGKSRSAAKVAASAKNGKKGGWPKGRPRKPKTDTAGAGVSPR